MGTEGLRYVNISRFSKRLRKELRKYGENPLVIRLDAKEGSVAVYHKHWMYTNWREAPLVYIGGKYNFKYNKIYYLWLD